jgi:hypothetical protein
VLTPPAGLKVFVATRPVDFRKGADGLELFAKEVRIGLKGGGHARRSLRYSVGVAPMRRRNTVAMCCEEAKPQA